MKPDMVISAGALACCWIWLPAQTRALHVCLRGFRSGTGSLPRYEDVRASLTCKSFLPKAEVQPTHDRLKNKTSQNKSGPLNEYLGWKMCLFVSSRRLFEVIWKVLGSWICSWIVRLKSLTWQLQDQLSRSGLWHQNHGRSRLNQILHDTLTSPDSRPGPFRRCLLVSEAAVRAEGRCAGRMIYCFEDGGANMCHVDFGTRKTGKERDNPWWKLYGSQWLISSPHWLLCLTTCTWKPWHP